MTGDLIGVDDAGAVERTVEALRAGGTIVVPTDTVYGLAARAADAVATRRLFEHKGRAADVPIAVLCTSSEQAFDLAGEVPEIARTLAERHWPGPLTMVLHRRTDLGWELGEPRHTVGVRCPDHDLVRAVTAAVGPIATTSANRHGTPTPAEAELAAASLTGRVDLVVDGGSLGGTASTVVDVTSGEMIVLRQGTIRFDGD